MSQVTNATNNYFGSNDTWHFVPYSAFSFRESVMLNPHNLATETFVNSLQVLTWSFAMGYQLAYDLNWVRNSDLRSMPCVITGNYMSFCSPRPLFFFSTSALMLAFPPQAIKQNPRLDTWLRATLGLQNLLIGAHIDQPVADYSIRQSSPDTGIPTGGLCRHIPVAPHHILRRRSHPRQM